MGGTTTAGDVVRRTDEEIRRALVVDLDDGFTTLVASHQPGVYSGVVRLCDTREAAQDVAQETFLRAYRALGSWDEQRIMDLEVRPWLWTIALNVCRTRATKATNDVALHAGHDRGTTDPEPLDDAVWIRRLERLTSPQRTAVVLRHVVDLPISEIVAVVDRPAGTVKADISRGLSVLRRTIEREEMT